MATQEITIKQGEPVTLPSGDTIELHHTGKLTEGAITSETAILTVTTPDPE